MAKKPSVGGGGNPPSANTRIRLFNGLWRRISGNDVKSYATYTNALAGGPGWGPQDSAWCSENLDGLM